MQRKLLTSAQPKLCLATQLFILLSAILVFNSGVEAGDPVQKWIARYNGPASAYDQPATRAVVVDATGNVFIAGTSQGSGTDDDFVVTKYDATGNPSSTWPDVGFGIGVRRYNGIGNGADSVRAIAVDNSGNVIVTGQSYIQAVQVGTNYYTCCNGWSCGTCSYPVFQYDQDIVTIKYTATGAIAWAGTYSSGYQLDYPTAIAVDGSGNVYVTGNSHDIIPDFVTIKYDANGNGTPSATWPSTGFGQGVRRYNGPGNSSDYSTAIAVDSEANVYVTGQSWSVNRWDYATIKYDSIGNLSASWPDNGFGQGVRRYNGPSNNDDLPTALKVDDAGNVYITGRSWSGSNYDLATIKYQANGNVEWVTSFDSPWHDHAISLDIDRNRNVYIGGYSDSGGGDYVTLKYDPAGTQLWAKTYNGAANSYDYPAAIAVDQNGNAYVTGYSYGLAGYEYLTLKYDGAGNRSPDWPDTGAGLGVRRYQGPISNGDFAAGIALDSTGNVYVSGHSAGLSGSYDITTVKYLARVPNCDAPTGRVSWWKGEGNTNDTRSGINGEWIGYHSYQLGQIGQAWGLGLTLNGNNGYVQVNDPSNILYPANLPFSLSAWVKSTANGAVQVIMERYECGGSCPGADSLYTMYIGADGTPRGMIRDTIEQTTFLTGSTPIQDGKFHFVAMVNDGTNLVLYVDGKVADQKPLTNHSVIRDDDGENDPLLIGASTVGGTTTRKEFFNGIIDEAQYWNVGLSASQISDLYFCQTSVATPLEAETPAGDATVTVTSAPKTEGEAGAVATLINKDAGATLTVQNLSSNPEGFQLGGATYVDLKVAGADSSDVLDAKFYYPNNVDDSTLVLKHYDPSTKSYVTVLSSGGALPDKNMQDNLDGTISGGRFTVKFDATSTPKITELTGTVFAIAPPPGTTVTLNSSAQPSDLGQSVTLTASINVNEGASGTPTGSVKFLDNGVEIGTGVLGGSEASIESSVLNGGDHTITAVYLGDSNFQEMPSAPLIQSVNKATTSVTLQASSNPSAIGQPVIFSATLTGVPGFVPTGSVTFQIDGQDAGTVEVQGAAATITIDTLAEGDHSVSATYSGDTSFNAAQATTLLQTVASPSVTITLNSSANPSLYGQPITLTAVVIQSGSAQPPTGTVKFTDNGVDLGSAVLSQVGGSYEASVTTSSIFAVGNHSIVAEYSGDSIYESNSSDALTQSVTYSFTGFFQPVENGPTFNSAKAGAAIPVKFNLAGNQGMNILAPGYPASHPVNCTGGTADTIEETVTASYSGLQYDPAFDQYTYVWKTDKAWDGTCRKLNVRLADGTDHVAYFKFTR